MSEEIYKRIEELINNCSGDWAELAADKMGITADAVRRIRRGEIGRKDMTRQLELIDVLKDLAKDYQTRIKKATK